jgi:hypothetical protein
VHSERRATANHAARRAGGPNPPLEAPQRVGPGRRRAALLHASRRPACTCTHARSSGSSVYARFTNCATNNGTTRQRTSQSQQQCVVPVDAEDGDEPERHDE